jgi:hypothetical protein
VKVDLALLDELRAHGVQAAAFAGGELSSVSFFDPRVLAEASAARLLAEQLGEETPAAMLAKIKRIEQDETLPELERQALVTKLENDLIYGASS